MVSIDLSPVVNGVIVPLLTPILLAVATWAISRIAKYAHFQIQDGQRQVVADAITSGIAYAQKTLGPLEIVSADARIATAVSYVLPKVPDALKSLGVTPAHLAQIVAAKLPA